jgi:hypothetical protein
LPVFPALHRAGFPVLLVAAIAPLMRPPAGFSADFDPHLASVQDVELCMHIFGGACPVNERLRETLAARP